jgi:hypothetical protein
MLAAGFCSRGGTGSVGEVLAEHRHVIVGVGAKRQDAGEHAIHDDAERVDVDAGVGLEAAAQLGGDVLGGADDAALDGERVIALGEAVVDDLGDAEVEDLDEVGVAVALHAEAVLGLHVAVDDALGVGGGEGRADLHDDVADAKPRHDADALQGAAEVLALEVLHHQVGLAAAGQ